MKENSLTSKALNATKWTTITEVSSKIITPLTNMILARILVPEAFGVVATVTMIMSFADMFTDAGFQKYLIQHDFKTNGEKHLNANVAFWTNLTISTVLCVIIIIFRNQIAVLTGNKELNNVIGVSSIVLILTSFSSIQIALYRRDFDFKTLFLVRMVSVCIPFVITIPLALLGFSYWALIIGQIAMQISNTVLLTVKSKWKPRIYYDVGILKEMFSFSMWSLFEAISIWFSFWIDIFIIGNVFNQYYVGLYQTSIVMVNSIMNIIAVSTVPVLFSTLSRLKNDHSQFMKVFFKTQRFVSVLIFPLGVGIYLFSDLATQVLLGSQWSEASTIIGIYALIQSVLIVFGHYCSEVYRSMGRPKLSLIVQLLFLTVLIPTCVISAGFGFLTFVYARAWIILAFVLIHLIVMKVAVGVTIAASIKNVFPTFFSALAMGAFGFFLGNIGQGIIWSIISILLCTLYYFGALSLFPSMRKELFDIINKIKDKLFVRKFETINYKEKES
ncbi:MAG: polysaccharide biosynthesis protein [Herbinix sp.]|nr:polysaccharide biosynthesis protein [Herbinix sp.]